MKKAEVLRTAVVAASVWLGATGVALSGAEVHAGRYKSSGTNPDGSHYHGNATIKILSDTTCEIAWTSGGEDAPSSKGICMRDSDSFAAAYRMGDAFGLVIYKIHADGSLEGVWTVAGEQGAGTETLTPE